MNSLLVLTDHKKQRRSAVRYPLQLPVIFVWQDEGQHTSGGFTYDVSLDGASIQSTICPPVGCEVVIEVLIPSPNNSAEHLRIHCAGKVTRVTQKCGGFRFGVRGSFDDNQITRQMVF